MALLNNGKIKEAMPNGTLAGGGEGACGSTRSMMTIEVTKHAVCLVSHPFARCKRR